MHAFRKFVQDQMDERRWKATELARRSGLSKQVVSSILTDTREELTAKPSSETVAGVAKAFGISQDRVLLAVAEAMGLPVGRPVVVPDASSVSDDELIRVLAARLERKAGEGSGNAPSSKRAPGSGAAREVVNEEQTERLSLDEAANLGRRRAARRIGPVSPAQAGDD